MGFRKLTVAERDHLTELNTHRRLNGSKVIPNMRVSYLHDGNFTVALVRSDGGGLRVGVAKRNPRDGANPAIGERCALVRAFRAKAITVGG